MTKLMKERMRRWKHAINTERNHMHNQILELTTLQKIVIWRLTKIDTILEKYEIPKLEQE